MCPCDHPISLLYYLAAYLVGAGISYIIVQRIEIVYKMRGERSPFNGTYPPVEIFCWMWPIIIPACLGIFAFKFLSKIGNVIFKIFKKIAIKVAVIGISKSLLATDPNPEIRKLMEK